MQRLTTTSLVIGLQLLGLLAVASACERTEGELSRTPQVARSNNARVTGFGLGQVATRRSAEASVPIEGIDEGELGRQFRRALGELAMFHEEGQTDGPIINFHVAFGVGLGSADPPPGSGSGTGDDGEYVVLVIEVEGGSGDPRYQFEMNGLYRERLGPGEAPLATAERLVQAGIDDIVAGIRAEAAPRVASDDEVVALLGTVERDDLLPVVREVHRRRLSAAAPQLHPLLEAEEIDLVIAAITTLGRLRDEAAVSPMIDLISREHRELTELVLPVLGEIGSREARVYLETVADAHVLPRIRQLAREILDQQPVGP